MTLFEKRIPFNTRFVNILNGKQFTEQFLSLNPRGEVPVLVDDNIRHIPDSSHIMDYLEDNFSNGYVKLRPDEVDLRNRCDALNQQICALKVECLSFGSGVFSPKDLGINPKPPYSVERERTKIREVVDHRKRILRSEAKKFPQYADALNQKLKDVERDLPLITNREQYESLIIQFERVLDECEAELASHEDPNWWLVSPKLTIADVSLSILLYRLWLLGFEKRMWERTRPSVDRYFRRIRKVDSFRKATSMTDGMGYLLDFLKNPYTWYAIGGLALLGGVYYLWTKGHPHIGLLGFAAKGADSCDCPVHGEPGVKGAKCNVPKVSAPKPPPPPPITDANCSV